MNKNVKAVLIGLVCIPLLPLLLPAMFLYLLGSTVVFFLQEIGVINDD